MNFEDLTTEQKENKSVLVLVKDNKLAGVDALAKSKSTIEHGYVLGGPAVIPDALATQVADKTDMRFVK